MREGVLTVASYNIHRCYGVDLAYDPHRIAGVIGALEADVVGLQEVDTALKNGPGGDLTQLEAIARYTALDYVAGPSIPGDDGFYGNALLTRLEVVAIRLIDLSVARREPRCALDVDLRAPCGPLRVIVTHLGLATRERQAQIARLLAALPEPIEAPTVVLGDLNEWLPGSRNLRRLRRRLGYEVALRSFPSRRPVLALDRIWAAGPLRLLSAEVPKTPITRRASDHLPLRARLGFPAMIER